MPGDELQPIADWFEGFATYAPSALYRELSASVAQAPDVLALLLEAAPAQRLPMLLFAAVHAEVLRRGIAYPPDGSAFLAFCREHEALLRPVLRTRSTQTNEVRRCAYLRPLIAAASDGRPLALIEVGASAGLNLNLDRYAYAYEGPGDGVGVGDGGGTGAAERPAPSGSPCTVLSGGEAGSPVVIRSELLEGQPPLALPPVALRVGIDLAPAPDPDWLRACVFADQPERTALLDAALALAREHQPPLRQGDALELLPQVLAEVPDGLQPVVFHTAVTVYLDDDERARLNETASAATHVTAERGVEQGGFALEVDGRQLGSAHPHGTWLRWTA